MRMSCNDQVNFACLQAIHQPAQFPINAAVLFSSGGHAGPPFALSSKVRQDQHDACTTCTQRLHRIVNLALNRLEIKTCTA
jgi:hypothetical protein